MRLEGKVAIVTGGGGGIGAAVVESLAREGAAVVVNDYGVTVDGKEPSNEAADAVVEKVRRFGGQAIAHYGSVADYDVARELVDFAVETFGGLDILAATHGILRERMVFNMTEDEWADVVHVHLDGSFNCVRFASAHMRAQRSGSIVLFTSTAGLEGSPAQANYAAAKAGIVGLAWSTALAMGKYDVNVNVVAPSASTRMTDRLRDEFSGGPRGQVSPETVGAVTSALCAPEARHITGQVYTAAGNRVARWCHFTEVETAFQPREAWTTDEALETITSLFTAPPLTRFAKRNLVPPSVHDATERAATP